MTTEPTRLPLLPPARAATLKARGEKLPTCEHGLEAVANEAGEPRCPCCRRGIPAAAPVVELDATRPPKRGPARRARPPASSPQKLPDNVIPFRRTRGA